MRRLLVGIAAAAGVSVLVGTSAAPAVLDTRSTLDASSGTQADLPYVRAQIKKWSAVPQFTLKAPVIDSSKVKGQTIFNIPISSSIPFNAIIDKSQAQLAKRLGMNFIEFPNQGTPPEWAQGMTQAISRKVDLIHLVGANPLLLRPQVAAAKRAGIPVVSSRLFNVSQPKPTFLAGVVPVDFDQAGRLEADWAILDTGGKANVLIVESLDVSSAKSYVATIRTEFKTRCPECKVTVINVPIPQWATAMQGAVQSALGRDPNINYIIPIYDSMSQFITPAITLAGRDGKVHIATYNGTPFVLKEMQDSDVIRMDVGENLDWLAWAGMDQNLRVLVGAKPTTTERMALRVFTQANVRQTGTPPRFNAGYGKAYVKGYNRLWGRR
jgi:ribose transport system substrate-binding protein